MTPKKVFLSYSTENAAHQQWVIDLGEQLAAFNIDATIDVYALQLGQDMYAFMEKILSPEYDHVIVLSDASYQRKADARTGGVGAEVQLLTQQVYNAIEQTRVIPVFMEVDDQGQPTLPIFLKGRFALNFSDPNQYEQQYAKLCLTILGEPLHKKPALNNTGSIDKLKAMAKRKIEPTKKEKNTYEGDIEDVDNAHLGDTNASKDGEQYDKKNVMKGDVKRVKNFRLGDDYK